MLRGALQRVGSFLVKLGETPPAVVRPPTRRLRPEAERRLRRRLETRNGGAAVLAGSIQLLGLEQLKEVVGEAWAAVADKALEVAELAISRTLGPGDEFQRYDDDTFVLVFPGLDRAAAERRTQEISAEIGEILLAEIPGSEIRVGHRVAEVDCKSALDTGTSIFDAMARTLQEIAAEAKATYDRLRRELLQNARVVYAPMWSPKKRAVMIYRCMLDRASGQATLQHMRDLVGVQDLQRALFDIDCLVLGRVVEQLHTLVQKQNKAVFLVPLHFHTLRDKISRDEYTALCKAVPAAYAQYLIFEIHGMPADVLIGRILDLAGQMRAYGNGVALRAQIAPDDLPQLASHGIFGLAADLPASGQPTDRLAERLSELVRPAAKLGLHVLAHDANTVGLAEASARAEVDYIDGEAIAPKMETPRGVYRWSPH